jgi:hypothetical protein
LVTLALAAAGTLVVLAGYQLWQKRGPTPAQQAALTPKLAPQATRPAPAPAAAEQPDAAAAAHGALGPDGAVLADADFGATAGRQVLAVQRMPAGSGLPAPSAPPAKQEGETTAEVIRVSILVLEKGTWKEAFRADEHLKNRRGYLPGAPADAVPGWHMAYSQTPQDGFRLEFTPLGLPAGRKQATVHAAWNAKRREYDAVTASGKGILEVSATPGNAPVPIKP